MCEFACAHWLEVYRQSVLDNTNTTKPNYHGGTGSICYKDDSPPGSRPLDLTLFKLKRSKFNSANLIRFNPKN